MGIAIGLVFVPTAILPLNYFKRQRGLALGIVVSGGAFGGMIFPVGEDLYGYLVIIYLLTSI